MSWIVLNFIQLSQVVSTCLQLSQLVFSCLKTSSVVSKRLLLSLKSKKKDISNFRLPSLHSLPSVDSPRPMIDLIGPGSSRGARCPQPGRISRPVTGLVSAALVVMVRRKTKRDHNFAPSINKFKFLSVGVRFVKIGWSLFFFSFWGFAFNGWHCVVLVGFQVLEWIRGRNLQVKSELKR